MQSSEQRCLFIDDDETSTRALIRRLQARNPNFQSLYAKSAESGLKLYRELAPEVVILDLSLDPLRGPDSGLELLPELLKISSDARVLVLTGHGAEEYGLKALELGASSFLSKPVLTNHLLSLISDGLSVAGLKRRYKQLCSKQSKSLVGFETRSTKMSKVLENAQFAASNKQPLMITGETGTGKGLLAQAIHQAGPDNRKPFIRFQPNFGGSDLITSELFGHLKGAFTGAGENRRGLLEEVNGGTLFLDEVDELPLETQVLLLHVLQEKTFRRLGSNRDCHSDFRLIAATNRSVKTSLADKKLRLDFYHRIAHLTLEIPPLRERPEDIPDLAQDCLQSLSNRENLSVHGFSKEALAVLRACPWPGNIRELLAAVESGVYRASFANRRIVSSEDFGLNAETSLSLSQVTGSFSERIEQYKLQLIRETLEECNQNQSRAARILGLDRSSMRRILLRNPSLN